MPLRALPCAAPVHTQGSVMTAAGVQPSPIAAGPQLTSVPPDLHNCAALRELDLGNNRIAKLVLDLRTLGRLGSLQLYGAPGGAHLVHCHGRERACTARPVVCAHSAETPISQAHSSEPCSIPAGRQATRWSTCPSLRLRRRCAPCRSPT